MAARSLPLLLFLLISFAPDALPPFFAAGAAAPLCARSGASFLDDLRSECPRWIEPSPPLEVDQEFLDRVLNERENYGYYSVLFYASWCPFSANIRPIFDVLSSMFPQIKHLLVEESAVMPSVLSRYGIHSFPAIMLSNQTVTVRYHGAKDLNALIQFFQKTTGFDPIADLVVDQLPSSGNKRSLMHQAASLRELITKEPCLVFAMLFILLKIVLSVLPVTYSHLKVLLISHAWHLNLHILYESRQLLVRVLYVIDINNLWAKLKLGNKTRNLRKGANNARVWASTLTSVSLGESSSRLPSSDS
ncbi:5'-adenylylsulfate reductase-like 5 [Canna indica]|uniref:5'-adenylylsulfate reductase-like 5 n=1 Tax=Canna indica TaxID=4628 RepID=A0AAQ3QCN8_9LILI|nr:5'-adenylylsulfate reductase-like 5 [Canna indica]